MTNIGCICDGGSSIFSATYEIMVTTLCVKNYFVPELGTAVSADWYLLQIDAD